MLGEKKRKRESLFFYTQVWNSSFLSLRRLPLASSTYRRDSTNLSPIYKPIFSRYWKPELTWPIFLILPYRTYLPSVRKGESFSELPTLLFSRNYRNWLFSAPYSGPLRLLLTWTTDLYLTLERTYRKKGSGIRAPEKEQRVTLNYLTWVTVLKDVTSGVSLRE